MKFLQLLVFLTMVTAAFLEDFPDKSVIWTAHDQLFFYSHRVEDWTSATITPGEFGQTISRAAFSGMQSVYGIASDYPTRHLVISDKQSQFLVIVDLETSHAAYFHMGTSKDIGQLTIDWLGRNVYWADTGYGWIAMKKLPVSSAHVNSLEPNFRVVADEYLERPTGLVVHPDKFYLFWTDTGETPKIERSDLTGGNRAIIVWHSLITPTTLCIDQSADRLYWSDPGRGTIEYSDFEGNGRQTLLSDQDIGYYGIAVFRDSLIYTVPAFNRTGYVSLKENNEGEHIQATLQTDVTLYHVLVYASELQQKNQNTLCDTVEKCDQMCLYMEQDAGFTCLCDDGYDLVSGRYCSADEKVLERHIIFTNENNICAIAISVLGLPTSTLLPVHCDIVTEETVITRFAMDMTEQAIFYTNGTVIYKQEAFKESRILLYWSNGTISDMDYNWKTEQLFWTEAGNGNLYYIDVNDEDPLEPNTKTLSDSADITNIAVDPHNRKVFWIAKNSDGYSLNVWDTVTDDTGLIQTSLLLKPTDLEYDRLKDRLLWNDDEGYVGMIYTDGTHERKYDSAKTSGEKRHAIAAYKNFILVTTAEDRQFDIMYELEPNAEVHMNLHHPYDGLVLDLHVYESTLQPSDLEPCEVDNGGCEHICLPGNTVKCACSLGYFLDTDESSCKTDVLNDNFFVILDTVHDRLYQIDRDTETPYAIEIDESNEPTALGFDSSRSEVIWVDADKHAVKKKKIGSRGEIALLTGVDDSAAVAVDVSTGNVYVSTGGNIVVVSQSGDKFTIVDSTKIAGTVGKIAVMAESGLMSWFERGDSLRIVIANMDGSNTRPISVNMKVPEDISFDSKDEKNLYWCDSKLDKIEKIDTLSLSTTIIYKERGLRPVAIDIVGDILYFVPQKQRKIIQINKNSGLGQTDVFESPLFGSFNNFFLGRNDAGHELCKICNGGCSNLCLPIGKNKKCACADGTSLKDDDSTCQYVDVCPQDSYTSKPGLDALAECCPNLPNVACQPRCQSGFDEKASVVTCKNGKWNVSLDGVCEASESKPLPIAYIAAGAGGGAALLVIVIVVSVCICRRKRSEPDKTGNGDIHHYTSGHGYEVANGVLSPDPPKQEPEQGPEVYDYLNETEMVDVSKMYVDLPTLDDGNEKEITRENSSSSGRYTSFPGYITATYERKEKVEPRPNYDTDYNKGADIIGGDGPDGYLRASSISSGSRRDASDGSFSTMAHPKTNFSGSRRHGEDPYAVKYTAGYGGSMSDGRVTIDSRTGRVSGDISRELRYSGHSSTRDHVSMPNSTRGHVSMSGSFGYSGHI